MADGLENASMNGKRGKAVGYCLETKRYQVKFDQGGATVKVRASSTFTDAT